MISQRKTLRFLLTRGVLDSCLRFTHDNKGKQAMPLLEQNPVGCSPLLPTLFGCSLVCEQTPYRCCGLHCPSVAVHLPWATSAALSGCSHRLIMTLSQMIMFCFYHVSSEMKASKDLLRGCSGAALRGLLTTVTVR